MRITGLHHRLGQNCRPNGLQKKFCRRDVMFVQVSIGLVAFNVLSQPEGWWRGITSLTSKKQSNKSVQKCRKGTTENTVHRKNIYYKRLSSILLFCSVDFCNDDTRTDNLALMKLVTLPNVQCVNYVESAYVNEQKDLVVCGGNYCFYTETTASSLSAFIYQSSALGKHMHHEAMPSHCLRNLHCTSLRVFCIYASHSKRESVFALLAVDSSAMLICRYQTTQCLSWIHQST